MVCEESQSPSSETAPSLELFKIDTADSSAESSFRELDNAFLQVYTYPSPLYFDACSFL